MIKLRYGNTNTFFIQGDGCGLLVDTDYAGTIRVFYKALKANGVGISDITYVLATHYHPDHIGLISELTERGVRLLLADVQRGQVHYSDHIFEKDGIPYRPIDETSATLISCDESRAFLREMGISGELIHTPSHSEDSVSLVLDCGDCIVGDLEPYEYLEAYEDNTVLKSDWEKIFTHRPKRVFFAHMPQRELQKEK